MQKADSRGLILRGISSGFPLSSFSQGRSRSWRAEVAVSCGLFCQIGQRQIQHFDDSGPVLGQGFSLMISTNFSSRASGSVGINHDGSGLTHADGVESWISHSSSQSCGNDVLCHTRLQRRLGGLPWCSPFRRKAPPPWTGISAVGIHNDFTSGESAVAIGSSDHEASGGIDVEFGFIVNQLCGQNGIENIFFDDVFMDLFLGCIGIMPWKGQTADGWAFHFHRIPRLPGSFRRGP